MYDELQGTWTYQAGASGTVTIPVGARILQIVVHSSSASGSVAMWGGTAIPVLSGETATFRFLHDLNLAPTAADTIVFTSTDSYFVEYLLKPGT